MSMEKPSNPIENLEQPKKEWEASLDEISPRAQKRLLNLEQYSVPDDPRPYPPHLRGLPPSNPEVRAEIERRAEEWKLWKARQEAEKVKTADSVVQEPQQKEERVDVMPKQEAVEKESSKEQTSAEKWDLFHER